MDPIDYAAAKSTPGTPRKEYDRTSAVGIIGSGGSSPGSSPGTAPRPYVRPGQYDNPFQSATDTALKQADPSGGFYSPQAQLDRMSRDKPITSSVDYKKMAGALADTRTSAYDRENQIREARMRGQGARTLQKIYAGEDEGYRSGLTNAYSQAAQRMGQVDTLKSEEQRAREATRGRIAGQSLQNAGFSYTTDSQERTADRDRDLRAVEVDRKYDLEDNRLGFLNRGQNADITSQALENAAKYGTSQAGQMYQPFGLGQMPTELGGTTGAAAATAARLGREAEVDRVNTEVDKYLPDGTNAEKAAMRLNMYSRETPYEPAEAQRLATRARDRGSYWGAGGKRLIKPEQVWQVPDGGPRSIINPFAMAGELGNSFFDLVKGERPFQGTRTRVMTNTGPAFMDNEEDPTYVQNYPTWAGEPLADDAWQKSITNEGNIWDE